MLEVKNVSARYGKIQALKDVSITLSEGEIVALIGANGAGKSTLLNCISGLVKPSAGSITFEGAEISGKPAHVISQRGLIQVPEGRQILPALTVLENLQLGTSARSTRPPAYDLDGIFALFPVLKERCSSPAASLSGGQQQMLAIGRALMGSPRLLLLDEPSLGLSPLMSKQVFSTLRQLNLSGLTVLLVEQNARQALRLTTRAYVLERGRVVHQGPSAALESDPAIVAHYLGEAPRRSVAARS